MLTAPAVVRSRFKWHTRATWNARENRIPSLVWLALIWFGMVAGFGLDMPRFSTSLRRRYGGGCSCRRLHRVAAARFRALRH